MVRPSDTILTDDQESKNKSLNPIQDEYTECCKSIGCNSDANQNTSLHIKETRKRKNETTENIDLHENKISNLDTEINDSYFQEATFENEPLSFTNDVDKSDFLSLLKCPERYMTERCLCNDNECTYMRLNGTYMKECHCDCHNRFMPNNIRVKMENTIVQHISTNLLQEHVRILSLGAGAYLQDFMIILRLVDAGLRSAHISFVDPDPCSKAYNDFKYFLQKIYKNYQMENLSCIHYTDIDQVDSNEEFDVIYAIDFEFNSKEYVLVHRHIEVHNDFLKFSHPDKASRDLIKAVKLLTSKEHGLILVSKCNIRMHFNS